MHQRNHRTRLNLEVLEDRAVPAALTTPNLLESDVVDQSALARRFADSSAPLPDGLNVVTLAELAAVSSTILPQSVEVSSAPGFLSLSSSSGTQVQPGTSSPLVPNSSLSPDVNALGFTGRLVLPGTGVQARAAGGTGPLSQPPGLFLVGGSQSPSEVSGTPAPADQGAGDEEPDGAGDGVIPDEVWTGTDWLQQTTVLRGEQLQT